jgi:hypothetical protein
MHLATAGRGVGAISPALAGILVASTACALVLAIRGRR